VKAGEINQVVLADPLFNEYSALRTEMLSGLIDAFQLEQGNGALNSFEAHFWKMGMQEGSRRCGAGIIGSDPTINEMATVEFL